MSKYTWGGSPCVRNDERMEGEAHPCYYCGTLIPVSKETKVCRKCHFQFCPNCGICFCNGIEEQQAALIELRNTYCCDAANFRIGMGPTSIWKRWNRQLRVVPHFKDALDNCRRIKGCEGNY